jgi:hypothetical protein
MEDLTVGIERKNVDEPDEAVDYGEQGRSAKVFLGWDGFGIGNESAIWLSTLEPGWSWQRNIKPNVPFETCPLHHREYVISGRIRYAMSDGSSVEARAGDHLLIDPGHQAEVIGDEACVLLDW